MDGFRHYASALAYTNAECLLVNAMAAARPWCTCSGKILPCEGDKAQEQEQEQEQDAQSSCGCSIPRSV